MEAISLFPKGLQKEDNSRWFLHPEREIECSISRDGDLFITIIR